MKKLTKTLVEKVSPGRADKFLWDGVLSGFGVKVTPKGRRVYIVQYRMGGRGTTTRRYTIGQHGALTTEQARKEAQKLLGKVKTGVDPAEEKRSRSDGITVSELCDIYFEDGCSTKKPSTLATDRSNVERHIKPLIGRRRVTKIKSADIERLQAEIARGKSAKDVKTGPRGRARIRGGKAIAARTVALLGGIFTFAVKHGYCEGNPVTGVKLLTPDKRERFLSEDELTRLGVALHAYEQDGGNVYAVAAIRLLLLTGCRKSEVLTLKWEHVDFEHECLRLPDSKTGAKVVKLGIAAIDLLKSLPHVADCLYVIAGEHGKHLVGLQKIWSRIRTSAQLEDVRLHDLRHTWASYGVGAGHSLYTVGKALGQRQSKTMERYAHLKDDPLKHVIDDVSNTLNDTLNAGHTVH